MQKSRQSGSRDTSFGRPAITEWISTYRCGHPSPQHCHARTRPEPGMPSRLTTPMTRTTTSATSSRAQTASATDHAVNATPRTSASARFPSPWFRLDIAPHRLRNCRTMSARPEHIREHGGSLDRAQADVDGMDRCADSRLTRGSWYTRLSSRERRESLAAATKP